MMRDNKREQSEVYFRSAMPLCSAKNYAEHRKGRTKFNINAVLIRSALWDALLAKNDGMPQGERLVKLNQIAIQQMQVLEGNSGRNLLK